MSAVPMVDQFQQAHRRVSITLDENCERLKFELWIPCGWLALQKVANPTCQLSHVITRGSLQT